MLLIPSNDTLEINQSPEQDIVQCHRNVEMWRISTPKMNDSLSEMVWNAPEDFQIWDSLGLEGPNSLTDQRPDSNVEVFGIDFGPLNAMVPVSKAISEQGNDEQTSSLQENQHQERESNFLNCRF